MRVQCVVVVTSVLRTDFVLEYKRNKSVESMRIKGPTTIDLIIEVSQSVLCLQVIFEHFWTAIIDQFSLKKLQYQAGKSNIELTYAQPKTLRLTTTTSEITPTVRDEAKQRATKSNETAKDSDGRDGREFSPIMNVRSEARGEAAATKTNVSTSSSTSTDTSDDTATMFDLLTKALEVVKYMFEMVTSNWKSTWDCNKINPIIYKYK